MTTKQKEITQANDWDIKAVEAYLELGIGDDELDDFEEAYQGECDSDAEFVQNLLEDTGTIPNDLPCYVHIDWEGTARDVMMDYHEENGHYFRCL